MRRVGAFEAPRVPARPPKPPRYGKGAIYIVRLPDTGSLWASWQDGSRVTDFTGSAAEVKQWMSDTGVETIHSSSDIDLTREQ
jgi:hypothetical protein